MRQESKEGETVENGGGGQERSGQFGSSASRSPPFLSPPLPFPPARRRSYLWAQQTTATRTGAEKMPKSLPPPKPHIPPLRAPSPPPQQPPPRAVPAAREPLRKRRRRPSPSLTLSLAHSLLPLPPPPPKAVAKLLWRRETEEGPPPSRRSPPGCPGRERSPHSAQGTGELRPWASTGRLLLPRGDSCRLWTASMPRRHPGAFLPRRLCPAAATSLARNQPFPSSSPPPPPRRRRRCLRRGCCRWHQFRVRTQARAGWSPARQAGHRASRRQQPQVKLLRRARMKVRDQRVGEGRRAACGAAGPRGEHRLAVSLPGLTRRRWLFWRPPSKGTSSLNSPHTLYSNKEGT